MFVKVVPFAEDYPTVFLEAPQVNINVKIFDRWEEQDEWMDDVVDRYFDHSTRPLKGTPTEYFYNRIVDGEYLDVAKIDFIGTEEEEYEHVFAGLCDIYLLNDNGDTIDKYDLNIMQDTVKRKFQGYPQKELLEKSQEELQVG